MMIQVQQRQQSVNCDNTLKRSFRSIFWLLTLLLCSVCSMSNVLAAPSQSEIGLWWNPAKPGRGYTLDLINGNLVLIIYAYDQSGKPEWTMASGPLSESDWSQPLQRFRFFPKKTPTSESNTITSQTVGNATLSFQDATHARLNWTMGSNSGSELIELFSDVISNTPAERAGLWYSPSLNGSGFTFFNKAAKFGAVHYFYDDSGMPTWSLGVRSAGNPNLRQTLAMDVFSGGACLACPRKIPVASSLGQLDLALTSAIHGVGVSQYANSQISQRHTFQPLLRLSSEQQAQDLASGADPAFVQANSLTVSDTQTIIAQAVAEARARGARATMAVVDRVGNVLAVFRMNGANTTVKISTERDPLVTTGLEGIELADLDGVAAIAKAITGAYLSSAGNAFTTRTANQIIQENFNPLEKGQPGGPLFGVQFSQLPCSDLSARFGADGLVGPKRSPLGLSADAGGLPLYKNGVVVGGVGVIADGLYGIDRTITDVDTDKDELIALAATFGFEPPADRRADRITVEGKLFRYVDKGFNGLASNPANTLGFNTLPGQLIAVRGYTMPALNGVVQIIPGTVFGSAASGVRTDAGENFPDQQAFVLVDAFNQPRYAPKAGQNLNIGEVQQILSDALSVAEQARAQIRRPLNTAARVTISVVDVNGDILGVVRSADAPVFGTDVSLQKARTAAFFSSANAASALLNATDAIYFGSGTRSSIAEYVGAAQRFLDDPDVLTGQVAFSDRAGGNLSRPFYPDGLNTTEHGPFSKPFDQWSPFSTGLQLDLIVNGVLSHVVFALGLVDDDIGPSCTDVPIATLNTLASVAKIPATELTIGTPVSALANGIQIFPGSVPIYKGNQLVGGIGVSGDGVDQDDLIAFLGLHNAGIKLGGVGNAPVAMRADQLLPKGVRLRYVQCPIAPFRNQNSQNVCQGK